MQLNVIDPSKVGDWKNASTRGSTKSRRTGLDDAALEANVSGNTAQKVKQMRALVVHQAQRELVVPLGKSAPEISELHGAHATKRADRSVRHIAQEAFRGAHELEIVNHSEPPVLQPGKGVQFFPLGYRHRKRFFSENMLAKFEGLPDEGIMAEGSGGDGHHVHIL